MGSNNQRLPTTTLDLATSGPPPLVARQQPTAKKATTRQHSRQQHGNIENLTTTKVGNKRHLIQREFVAHDNNTTETNYNRLATNYTDIEDRKPDLTAADIADIKFAKLKVRVGALMKAYWSDGLSVRELEEEMRDQRHFSNGNIGKYYAIINANFYRAQMQ
jgi:hypothetical protein